MRLPWQTKKIEKRASYDAQIIAALHAAALNEAADVAATSTVQAACGLLGRALSAATVTPQTAITRAISPQYLYTLGESLVLRGEHLSLIDVVDGTPQLVGASEWDITGTSLNQREWMYKLTLPVPSGTLSRTVPGASVVAYPTAQRLDTVARHKRYRGQRRIRRTHGRRRRRVCAKKSATQRARGLSVWPGFEDADPDDEDDPWTALINDIRTAKAKSVLMPSAPATLIQGVVAAASAPPTFGTVHLQPSVPEDLQTLRDRVSAGLYAAVGIMPAIFDGDSSTAVQRGHASACTIWF